MPPVEGNGMRLLGQHDLGGQGSCGEGIALLEHGGAPVPLPGSRAGPANFSVLDVTDPTGAPAAHPDPAAARRCPVQLAGPRGRAAAWWPTRWPGPACGRPGIEIFDLSRPAQPSPVGFLDLSGPQSRGTHWVGYTGGRYAFLSTGTADSRPASPLDDQFPVIVDLSEPGRPVEAGRWWLPGTQEQRRPRPAGAAPDVRLGFPRAQRQRLPRRPDRAYVGYLDAGAIILDIADVSAPRLVSRLDYHPPMPGSPTPCCRCPGGTCW